MWVRYRTYLALAALLAALIVGGAAVLGRGTGWLVGLAVVAAGITAFALLDRDRRSRTLEGSLERFERRVGEAADERLAMRMRAETAGRFREEFVAAVRHELNTPLNSILGFASVLLQEVDGPLEPAQRQDVEAIRDAGTYLRELVEAVLAEWVPSRGERGTIQDVPVRRLLDEVARLLGGQVVDKDIALRVEVADPDLTIVADPRRLRQILINLGTNAIRATGRGVVTFEARAEGPDKVRVSVRDTGRGIAADELPRLFGEFEQVGSAESRRGGTGLGLALTRDMVEWHGGRIEVESTLGEGTVFHVHLPVEAD